MVCSSSLVMAQSTLCHVNNDPLLQSLPRSPGSAFRESFQVNVLVMELITAQTLRNHETPKEEIAVYEFDLAQSIISMQ